MPSPGDLPNPRFKLRSPVLQVDSLSSEPPGKPHNIYMIINITIEILYSRSKLLYINIKYKYVYKEIYFKKLAHTVMGSGMPKI